MKPLINKGLGCNLKQADPISREDEAKLWDTHVFGRDNLEQLQQTVFFFGSKLFGLRGCDEHHDLHCEQFETGSDSRGKFIRFIGRSTKTYKGGLSQLNVSNKDIKHYCEPVGNELAPLSYVDEQEIIRKTGHRSSTAIRKYKRANDETSANVSHILDPPKPIQENCQILKEIPDNSTTPEKRLCTEIILRSESDSRSKHDASKVYNNCQIHYYMNMSAKDQ
ncbi:unnamed protein product [Mytilus coruscus]|uniref:ZMYM2-like/QRICH1 C-terminal domain-containing protein n=1 Tax=Mytilus coruscus TaxID=42192 RepID=A0A6J8BVS2_MYTCO|nr:unnamed protein product [Mytilus coruscus]